MTGVQTCALPIYHGDGTCTVTDRLVVEPRVGLLRPVVERVVRFLFDHRHRCLVERFGPVGLALEA